MEGDPGSAPDVLDVLDASLVAYFRLLTTTSVGVSRIEEDERYLLFAGGHDYPGTYTNGLLRKNPASGPAITSAELLARADGFFGPLGRSSVAWVRTHRDADLDQELRRREYDVRPPAAGSDAVVLTRRDPDWLDRSEHLEMFAGLAAGDDPVGVGETHDEDDLRAFLRLAGDCYDLAGAELALVEGLLFSLDSLRHPDNHVYVAKRRRTGQVLGGLTTYVADCGDRRAGFNSWAVSDPAARGRGIGRALTLTSARAAFADDVALVWGVASRIGGPIWRSLGFETPTRYARYVVPAPEGPGSRGPAGPESDRSRPVRRRRDRPA